MDRHCYFCTEEVGSGWPLGDGPATACGACTGRILELAYTAEKARRYSREHAVVTEEPIILLSEVKIVDIDGVRCLVRETTTRVKTTCAKCDAPVGPETDVCCKCARYG